MTFEVRWLVNQFLRLTLLYYAAQRTNWRDRASRSNWATRIKIL
eukprot:SAG31_NODE_26592_length_439_cov_1.976471_1_plen_43_part_10